MTPPQLTGPRLAPADGGKADSLVILAHGYGADGQDLIGLAAEWRRVLPNTAFVAPNAPERCGMSPMGYQWFPITAMREEDLIAGVSSAAPTLENFIDQELKRHELDASRLALAGFSQGTMMSLHVGLRRKVAPAAILGFSGALVGVELLEKEIAHRPPVMLIHGDMDEMIPAAATHAAAQSLAGLGVPVEWHISQGIGHGIAPDGLEIGGRFIADAFAGKLQAGKP